MTDTTKRTGESLKLLFVTAPKIIKSSTRTNNRELNQRPPQYKCFTDELTRLVKRVHNHR